MNINNASGVIVSLSQVENGNAGPLQQPYQASVKKTISVWQGKDASSPIATHVSHGVTDTRQEILDFVVPIHHAYLIPNITAQLTGRATFAIKPPVDIPGVQSVVHLQIAPLQDTNRRELADFLVEQRLLTMSSHGEQHFDVATQTFRETAPGFNIYELLTQRCSRPTRSLGAWAERLTRGTPIASWIESKR